MSVNELSGYHCISSSIPSFRSNDLVFRYMGMFRRGLNDTSTSLHKRLRQKPSLSVQLQGVMEIQKAITMLVCKWQMIVCKEMLNSNIEMLWRVYKIEIINKPNSKIKQISWTLNRRIFRAIQMKIEKTRLPSKHKLTKKIRYVVFKWIEKND